MEKNVGIAVLVIFWTVKILMFPFQALGWLAALVWAGLVGGFLLFGEMFFDEEEENDLDVFEGSKHNLN